MINLQVIIRIVLMGIVWFGCSISCFSQIQPEEEIIEIETETVDPSELMEQLEALRKAPIDLNTARLSDLLDIPFMTPHYARAILKKRKAVGKFSQINQLREINELPPDWIDLIKAYVKIEPSRSIPFQNLFFDYRTRIERKYDHEIQTQDAHPEKIYQRCLLGYGKIVQGGFLLEKDPGESQFNDFQSYYLEVNRLPLNSQLIMGNYTLKIAQGLIWGSSFGQGFSSEPLNVIPRYQRHYKAYRSVNENAGLKGGAWKIENSYFSVICFASQTPLDAKLDENGAVISFYDTGLHRNINEQARKDQVRETVWGSSFQFNLLPDVQIGATYSRQNFNRQVDLSDSHRKCFGFAGRSNQMIGIDFNCFFRRLNLFGEWSQSGSVASAFQTGGILATAPIQLTIFFRHYAPGFFSFHGNAFGRCSGTPANEHGFYSGIDYRLSRMTTFKAYVDFYRTLWRTYYDPMPVRLQRVFAQLTHKFSQTWQASTQWRVKNVNDLEKSYNLRFQLDIQLSERFLLRNRIEKKWTRFVQPVLWHQSKTIPEAGWCVYQNLAFKLGQALSVQTRMCFFDIPSSELRIYTYENGVPGTMTNQVLNGRGSRWYVLMKYDWQHLATFALKYGSTYYDDLVTIQHGMEALGHLTDNDFAFVIDFSI